MGDPPVHAVGPYTLTRVLGRGTTGVVKLGEHRDDKSQVAVKIITKDRILRHARMREIVYAEIEALRRLDHRNVLRLLDVEENAEYLHLIMEYVPGGDLYDYLMLKGALSLDDARNIFVQLLAALDSCHHASTCHLDIKPENILVFKTPGEGGDKAAEKVDQIKLSDFGFATKVEEGTMLRMQCGTLYYASPEVTMGVSYNGMMADVWSCGVVLYALLTGKLPFIDENINRYYAKLNSGAFEMPPFLPDEVKDLIAKTLVVNPKKRISLQKMIGHPWIKHEYLAYTGTVPAPPPPVTPQSQSQTLTLPLSPNDQMPPVTAEPGTPNSSTVLCADLAELALDPGSARSDAAARAAIGPSPTGDKIKPVFSSPTLSDRRSSTPPLTVEVKSRSRSQTSS